jgi:hypothetical protein
MSENARCRRFLHHLRVGEAFTTSELATTVFDDRNDDATSVMGKQRRALKRAVIIELVDVADETSRYDPGFAFSSRAPAREKFTANIMVYRFDELD